MSNKLAFCISGGFSGGLTAIWYGTSQLWMEGGEVISVSSLGLCLLFLAGCGTGISFCFLLSVIFDKPLGRISALTTIGAGVFAGALSSVATCFCVSVIFFTFPFPWLWKLMTEKQA
jgi:hypothetical protein